ncbi:MAG: LysM peptidoglycan-binding domain-containing protein [Pseudomonadales bacterium]|nr:LysM peptidoglycan-binding domain-containing protein [Pseudomonadales bacterium]
MKNSRFKHILTVPLMAFLALMAYANVHAQSALLKRDLPESYTVLEDDTLWNIASQFLQDPERWPEIWQPDPYLDNSDLIYPGDILRVSAVRGTPRILVSRGDRSLGSIEPQIRVERLESSIPEIPLESIESAFTRNRIISEELFESAPYLVENLGANLAIATGDEVYARGTWPVGTTSFEVYRAGRIYEGPVDDVFLGLEAEYLGFASITEDIDDDLRRLLINNSSKEIRVGDRLLIREEQRLDSTIYPSEPDQQVEGRIIAFLSGEAMASQLDTAVINLGTLDLLKAGDVLAVTDESTSMVDEVERSRLSFRERIRAIFRGERLEVPGADLGTLLVYKTFNSLSYAVILSSLEPLALNTRVASP